MGTKHCPLCKKTLHSEFAVTGFCALCGMPLEKSQTVLWKQEHDLYKFCSKTCLIQFREELHA